MATVPAVLLEAGATPEVIGAIAILPLLLASTETTSTSTTSRPLTEVEAMLADELAKAWAQEDQAKRTALRVAKLCQERLTRALQTVELAEKNREAVKPVPSWVPPVLGMALGGFTGALADRKTAAGPLVGVGLGAVLGGGVLLVW